MTYKMKVEVALCGRNPALKALVSLDKLNQNKSGITQLLLLLHT